jgi:hypothetical protein
MSCGVPLEWRYLFAPGSAFARAAATEYVPTAMMFASLYGLLGVRARDLCAKLPSQRPLARAPLRPLTALCLLSAACSGNGTGDPPAGSGKQFNVILPTLATETEIWLFVVDDAPDAAGVALRERFLSAFVAKQTDLSQSWCARDPEAWRPLDRRAVIALPSASGTARFHGPDTVPELALQTRQPTSAALQTWSQTIAATVEAHIAGEGAQNAVLSTLTDGIALLSGERSPSSTAEADLVASASITEPLVALVLVVVTGHEDQSEAEPVDYALSNLAGDAVVAVEQLVLPAADPTVPCDGVRATTARYDAWLAASNLSSPGTWSVGDDCPLVVAGDAVECFPSARCIDGTPLSLADGRAACRLYAQTSQASCPAELGWFEPESPVASDWSGTDAGRICEVRQLEAMALEACQTLECSGCTAGFCFTEVSEFAVSCTDPADSLLRLVGGAGRDADGPMRLVCDAE